MRHFFVCCAAVLALSAPRAAADQIWSTWDVDAGESIGDIAYRSDLSDGTSHFVLNEAETSFFVDGYVNRSPNGGESMTGWYAMHELGGQNQPACPEGPAVLPWGEEVAHWGYLELSTTPNYSWSMVLTICGSGEYASTIVASWN